MTSCTDICRVTFDTCSQSYVVENKKCFWKCFFYIIQLTINQSSVSGYINYIKLNGYGLNPNSSSYGKRNELSVQANSLNSVAGNERIDANQSQIKVKRKAWEYLASKRFVLLARVFYIAIVYFVNNFLTNKELRLKPSEGHSEPW